MDKKVLVVCRGNSCRSPFMEAALKKKYSKNVDVQSAGISEKAKGRNPASSGSVEMAKKFLGVDLTSHRSRHISEVTLSEIDLIICMDKRDAEAMNIMRASQHTDIIVANEEGGGIPNPWKKGMSAYEEMALAILHASDKILTEYF